MSTLRVTAGLLAAALAAAPVAAQIRAAAVEAHAVRPVPAAPTLAPSLSAPSLVAPTLTAPGTSPLPTPSVLPNVHAAQAPTAILATPAAPVAAVLPAKAEPAALPQSAAPLEAVAGRAAPEAAPEAPKGAEQQSAEAARLFDNAWVDAAAATRLVGFDPSGAPGDLMSDRSKREWSTTVRVVGKPLVVKRFTSLSKYSDARSAAQNELLSRLIVADPAFAPVFKDAFTMPAAVAYEKESWNPFAKTKTYLAMEVASGKSIGSFQLSDRRAWVPLRLHGPLFALARLLGLGDMNPGGLLVDDAGRYSLIDTEVGRTESRPNPKMFIPADMPWVDYHALDEPSDFAPTLAAFKAAFAKAEADGSLAKLLAKAGLTPKEVRRDLALLKGNLSRLDEVLAADIHVANRTFLKDAATWELDEAQARTLSGVNRALLTLDGGLAERRAAAMRDAARDALNAAGEVTMTYWVLGAREWAELSRSPKARARLAALAADDGAMLPKKDGAGALLKLLPPL